MDYNERKAFIQAIDILAKAIDRQTITMIYLQSNKKKENSLEDAVKVFEEIKEGASIL